MRNSAFHILHSALAYELRNEKGHDIGQNRHRQLSRHDRAKAPGQITLVDPFPIVVLAGDGEYKPGQSKEEKPKPIYQLSTPSAGYQKGRYPARQLSGDD